MIAGLFLSMAVSAGAFTLDEGARAYEQGDFGRAEEVFRDRAREDPQDRNARYNLGGALYRQERYEESSRAYAEALEKSPPWADAWYNLGNALYRQDRFKDAIAAYERALKAAPSDADARHNLEMARKRLAQEPEKDKSRPEDKPKEPEGVTPTPTPEARKGEQKQKDKEGDQDEGGDRQKGDRQDTARKKERNDPNAKEQGQEPNPSPGKDESSARREQARKELGMTDSQVDQMLSRMERQERQLQPYFQPDPKRARKKDDVFNMLPREQAELMRRFFGQSLGQQQGPATPIEDW